MIKRINKLYSTIYYSCCMDDKGFKTCQAQCPVQETGLHFDLLLFIYRKQFANIKWNTSFSIISPLTNGVCQGGVISAILYCFYCNSLVTDLRRCGFACQFIIFFGYSENNILLDRNMLPQKCLIYVNDLKMSIT